LRLGFHSSWTFIRFFKESLENSDTKYMKKRIDVDVTTTKHKGIKGLFEGALRRFKTATHVLTMLPVYSLGCVMLGLCITPGVAIFRAVNAWTATSSVLVQDLSFGLALAFGYLAYGFSLVLLAPAINFAIGGRLKPWRGPYYSAEVFKWFVHNALTYVPRFTFLEMITPSPMSLAFYRMMGMKIGRGTVINTTWISDPSLITLGDKVTLGGSVTLVAHYGQAGLLIIAPVKIGNGCTIGLKATVMGGAVIGDGARILPHSVVLPKTVIPDGETWGGVPARKIESEKTPTRLKKSS